MSDGCSLPPTMSRSRHTPRIIDGPGISRSREALTASLDEYVPLQSDMIIPLNSKSRRRMSRSRPGCSATWTLSMRL
jgi:hypothetical protein